MGKPRVHSVEFDNEHEAVAFVRALFLKAVDVCTFRDGPAVTILDGSQDGQGVVVAEVAKRFAPIVVRIGPR
jgi:hypothetical protein